MSVINSNIFSGRAQLAVQKVDQGIAKSLQRLSTGLAINSASDGAAGMAIANRMKTQIAGLNKAIRNAQDGISLAQTSEGAVAEMVSMTQRMRELSIQSTNDTLTDQDRIYLDQEFQALKQQMGALVRQSRWSATPVLSPRQGFLDAVVPARVAGNSPIDTTQPVTGQYNIFINGQTVSVDLVQNEPASDRLDKLMQAINLGYAQHGAWARTSAAGGLEVFTDDGRDLSLWYDSSTPQLTSVNLGLGSPGQTQITDIRLSSATSAYPKISQGADYVEFSGYGGAGETISWPQVAVADVTQGAFSMVNGKLYQGDGNQSKLIGRIDTTLDGTQGKPLRISFSNTFVNGSFESSGSTLNNIAGWDTYAQRIKLNGGSTVAGYPTPTDATLPPRGAGETVSITGGTYSVQPVTGDATSGSTSLMLESKGLSVDAYGVVHGPAIVSQQAVTIEAGTTVSFDWKAQQGEDNFDVYAYLLNVDTGATVELLNNTGSVTNWAARTVNVPTTGDYKFVFVSGSYDATGGQATGARLYVDNIQVGTPAPPFSPSATDLDKIMSAVVYSDQTPFALSASVNGVQLTSGNFVSPQLALNALQTQISNKIADGTFQNMQLTQQGQTLRLQSTSVGETFTVSGVTSSSQFNALGSVEVRTGLMPESWIDGIANASAASTGAHVFKGVMASAELLENNPGIRIQLGANEGQYVLLELPDYGVPGGNLDTLLWDTSTREMEKALLRSTLTGQTLQGANGEPVIHIRSTDAARHALTTLDHEMNTMLEDQARLGASINRFIHAGDNLAVSSTELSTSRSRIEDTDYAVTASELVKQQIIQKAATSVLAQANLLPETVMELLQGTGP